MGKSSVFTVPVKRLKSVCNSELTGIFQNWIMKNSSNLKGSPSSSRRKRPFISLNSWAFRENLPSSERTHTRARPNHANDDAQKGCAMQLNAITLRWLPRVSTKVTIRTGKIYNPSSVVLQSLFLNFTRIAPVTKLPLSFSFRFSGRGRCHGNKTSKERQIFSIDSCFFLNSLSFPRWNFFILSYFVKMILNNILQGKNKGRSGGFTDITWFLIFNH